MDNATDTYQTLEGPSDPILFKEKKSKFFGYAFPIQVESEVKPIIERLRKQHHTAGHVCYAWQIGIDSPSYRVNDDGEPNNSAGMPIYGQIQSFGVTNTLVAVARIFGGTKLGVGGLITAYRTAAKMALEEATIIKKVQKTHYELVFDYAVLNKVMGLIKQSQLEIVSQRMQATCCLTLAVRKKETQTVEKLLATLYGVKVEKKDLGKDS